MKLNQKQIQEARQLRDDQEGAHARYDELLERRLKNLDPEFLKSLNENYDTDSFWYA